MTAEIRRTVAVVDTGGHKVIHTIEVPRAANAISPYLRLDADGDAVPAADGDSAPATAYTSRLAWRPFDEKDVAELLFAGRIGVVWEGRAEVGPHALCQRSFITPPRPEARRDTVNRLKLREQWWPFAPVWLPECCGQIWGEQAHLFRYMIGAARVSVAGSEVIPAAMHVDGTARPQVLQEDAGVVGNILRALRRSGAPPVLLNTSFNGPDEPIVNSPAEAAVTLDRLGLDFIALGDYMATAAGKGGYVLAQSPTL